MAVSTHDIGDDLGHKLEEGHSDVNFFGLGQEACFRLGHGPRPFDEFVEKEQ